MHIFHCTAYPFPYVIFGPPGEVLQHNITNQELKRQTS